MKFIPLLSPKSDVLHQRSKQKKSYEHEMIVPALYQWTQTPHSNNHWNIWSIFKSQCWTAAAGRQWFPHPELPLSPSDSCPHSFTPIALILFDLCVNLHLHVSSSTVLPPITSPGQHDNCSTSPIGTTDAEPLALGKKKLVKLTRFLYRLRTCLFVHLSCDFNNVSKKDC